MGKSMETNDFRESMESTENQRTMTDPAQVLLHHGVEKTVGHDNSTNTSSSNLLRRSKRLVSDDSLSDIESDEAVSGLDNADLPQDPNQRRREKEWLRLKRLAARREQEQAMKRPKNEKVLTRWSLERRPCPR